jgi:predicted transcriptional regulator
MAYISDLKRLRVEEGLSISELARSAGVDRGTVNAVEDKFNCREEKCASILRALNKKRRENGKTLLIAEKLIILGGKSR